MRTQRTAGADWAFLRDASALVVLDILEPPAPTMPMPLMRTRLIREVRNDGGPRDPNEVADSFAADLVRLEVESVMSDAHYRALVLHRMSARDIALLSAPVSPDDIAQAYSWTRTAIHSRRLLLEPSPRLRQQLVDVRMRPTANGQLRPDLKRKDGGHGDIVAALVLAVYQACKLGDEYRHRGALSRHAQLDPRYSGADLADVGHMAEYASEIEDD